MMITMDQPNHSTQIRSEPVKIDGSREREGLEIGDY